MPWVSRAETYFNILLIILAALFYVFKFHHDPLEMAVMTPEWEIQYIYSTYILTLMSNSVSQ